MELEGTIVFDLPLQEGINKAGNPWKRKEWVLETGGMYPRRVMFMAFNNRIDTMQLEVGKSYAISIELSSREFNGRWYTDVIALGARPIEGINMGMQPQQGNFGSQPAPGFSQPQQGAQQPAFGQPAAPAPDPFAGSEDNTDNLPF